MDKKYIQPECENDAVFLPASLRNGVESLHGCENELYIVYHNNDSNDGNGSFEIEILDYETTLKLYKCTNENYKLFFDLLPYYFKGKWQYIDKGCDTSYDKLYSLYNDADFIVCRDGTVEDEFNFIKQWLMSKQNSNL